MLVVEAYPFRLPLFSIHRIPLKVARLSISTLADLYDELTMPANLRAAHKKNDLAVTKAYGFENILDDEPKIVAALMKRAIDKKLCKELMTHVL